MERRDLIPLSRIAVPTFGEGVVREGREEVVEDVPALQLDPVRLLVLLVDGQEYPLIYLIALNMGLITALFYLVQAMGVIKFFLMKRNMPRYLLPVMFLFLLLTGLQILPFFLIILAGFGTLDLWADFRKLNTVEKPEI